VPQLSSVEIWSALACDSGVRLALVPDATACQDRRQLDGQDSLALSFPRASNAYASVQEGRIVRVQYDDGSFDEWRIGPETTQGRSAQNELLVTLVCAPVLQDLAKGHVVRTEVDGLTYYDFEYLALTPAQHLAKILASAPAYFSAGTVDPTAVLDFRYAWDSCLSAARNLAAATRCELQARRNGTTGYYIDLVTAIGSAQPAVLLAAGRNVTQLQRTTNTDKQATRLVPKGGGEEGEALTIARAKWRVDAKVAGVSVDLVDPAGGKGPAVIADQFNGWYLRESGGTLRAITDTVVVSATVTRLSIATTSGFTVGDLLDLRSTAAGADVTFLDDPAARASYGLVPKVYERTDLIPGTQNLVVNPMLNGAYAAGLPANWAKVGAPTTAEETGASYTRRGTKSCHVTAAADGEGLACDAIVVAPTAAHPHFSAHATVRVTSGKVRFELLDVTNSATYPDGKTGESTVVSTGDWWDVGVAGVDLQAPGCASARVRVVAHGGAAEFYVDSAQLTQTADQRPFVAGDGARLLWQAANEELLVRAYPEVSIRLGVLDLNRLNAAQFPYDALVLGGTVTVRDDDLTTGIVINVSTRITVLQRDLLTPALTALELSSRAGEMTDYAVQPLKRKRLPGEGEATDLPLEYSECRAQVTDSDATTVTVTVTATAFSGTPTVQLVAVTGSAILNSGPAIGVPSASGTVWVFNRGALNAGAGQAQFRAVFSGTQSDDDFVTIEEQGRDTVPLLMRARVTTTSATQVVVRVAVADPYPQGAGSATVTYQELGVTGTSPASGGTVTPAATLTEAAGTYIDYTITRPAFQAGTGRVTFTVTAASRLTDSDAVDVPAQERDTVALIVQCRLLSTTESTGVVRVAVADPYPQGANSATITYSETGVSGTSPATGQTCTPAATITEAAGTYVDFTITRPALGSPTGRVTFLVTAAGRHAQSGAVDVPAVVRGLVAVAYWRANRLFVAWDGTGAVLSAKVAVSTAGYPADGTGVAVDGSTGTYDAGTFVYGNMVFVTITPYPQTGGGGTAGPVFHLRIKMTVAEDQNDETTGKRQRDAPYDDGDYALAAADALGREATGDLWVLSTNTILVGAAAAPASLTKTLRIPFAEMIPFDETTKFSVWVPPASLRTHDADNVAHFYYASAVLPKGVTVTTLKARLYRAAGTCTAEAKLLRISDAESTTTLATATLTTNAAWTTVTATCSQAVGDEAYIIEVQLNDGAGGLTGDTRWMWCELEYTMPSYDKGV
jgi:hypothetical protein